MKNKLIVITGPSGVGKTTIVEELLKYSQLNLQKVVTCTTRAKRSKDDLYNFMTIETFKKNIEKDKFIEYEEVYEGCFYGVLTETVENIQSRGKIPIVVLDIEGAIKLKEKMKRDILVISLMPKSKSVLVDRIQQRYEEKNKEERILKIEKEMTLCKLYIDFIVINSELENTIKKITTLLHNCINGPLLND